MQAVDKAAREEPPACMDRPIRRLSSGLSAMATLPAQTQLESINHALHAWLSEDPAAILLGEDIRSPYGGAFKATKGLSDEFPDRLINTPISEAGIVGVGNGLALGGARPIVEIMFGDFLTLCMDQLVNHAAKFGAMYGSSVVNPLVVRTPMGGGRGYGPTHSQNLEKHFVGTPELTVLVLHGRTHIESMYRSLRAVRTPVLLIENKLLYRERGDAPLPPGYSMLASDSDFPTTVLAPPAAPDITLVAFGRMSVPAERAAAHLAAKEEIFAELIFPLQVSPWDEHIVAASAARSGRVLVVEEGVREFDLGSEVIASVAIEARGDRQIRFRRVATAFTVIPSAPSLEKEVIPSESDIIQACLELFDE